jgi:NADPH:quinone reductase-like Zn-dependent oxidoreductase
MDDGKFIKALALEGFDRPPEVIDLPAPRPGPGEVLVRVHAASANAYDTVVAMGMMREYLPYEFPAVIGQDLAGAVEAVGEGVEAFAQGVRVFGTLGTKGVVHDGTFAELSNPQASALALTPDGVDDLQGGSLGVAGTTAMSAVDAVDPTAGTTVLVMGATGGVGSFAIQLATLRGAHVIASVRPGDEDFVAELGAAETADYTGDPTTTIRERHPKGVDALIDLVSRDPDAFAALVGLVRPGGRAVSSVGAAGEATEIGTVIVSNIGGNPAHLSPLAELVRAGKLRVAIRRTYALADAARALADFSNEHTLGKLVITMVKTESVEGDTEGS